MSGSDASTSGTGTTAASGGGGATASTSARPTDLRELSELVRDGGRLLPTGGGTASTWGAPVHEVDTVLHTSGLDRVLAFNPSDMTVAVGAGIRLAALQRMLAEHGQRVSLDADRIARGASVGGLLATADAGGLRHLHGSLSGLVLGATVVFADGTVARTGGHVVKNVAGYDLAKLVSGSLGTLAVIGEVVLRLHPRPENTGTLTVRCPVADAFRHANALARSPLEPVALDWEDGRFVARFEGTASSVASRLRRAAELVPAPGEQEQAPLPWPTDLVHPDSAVGPTGGSGSVRPSGETVVRVGARPSRVGELADELRSLTEQRELMTRWRSHLTAGVHTIRFTGADADAHAAVVGEWRARVEEAGGSLTLHDRIDGLDDRLQAWGTPPSSAPVLRALKTRLDPQHRLSPGRFAPWIGE